MARRKKKPAEMKEGNTERWLLTYSDMITLLLALFIILYSMSTINARKVAEIAENFGIAMGTVAQEGGTGTGTGSGTGRGGRGASVSPDALDEIYTILDEYIDQNHLENSVGLDTTDTYVKIQLKDVLMFVPDSAEMLPASQPVLQLIEDVVAKVYDRVDHITISGHTADVGNRTQASQQISWRLSTERAVTVLNSLVSYGLVPDKLSIEGYAYYEPVANNNTEEGRAKNRRVEITIYKYPEEASAASSSPSPEPSSDASSGSNATLAR